MRAYRSGVQGSGKLEFFILLTAIGIVAGILLDRLIQIEREAERTEVSLSVRNMRVGLRLAVGERIMRGQEDRMAELLAANPLDFLGDPLGRPLAGIAAAGQALEFGRWRFDRSSGVLTYRPRQPEAFDGRAELCWKVASLGTQHGRMVGIGLENLTYCEVSH